MRSTFRADLSRILRRSLDRHDITQAQLADAVGTTPQKVGRWVDHNSPEVPGAPDLALFQAAVARDVLAWVGSYQRVTIAEDLAFDTLDDHASHLHTVIREGSEVFAAYSKVAAERRTPSPAVRRNLMRELRESIGAQTALLRDLEAQEQAESHGVQRRPSQPQMKAVG